MTTLRIFFFVGIYLAFTNSYAQQGDTTIWESTSLKYDGIQEEAPLPSKFVFEGRKTVQWIQTNEGHTYLFEIVETVGAWADFSKDGSLVYKVRTPRLTGEIMTERKAGAVRIYVKITGKDNQTNGITCKISKIIKH